MTELANPEIVERSLVAHDHPPSTLMLNPAALRKQIDTFSECREMLIAWVRGNLVAGIDWLTIHTKINTGGKNDRGYWNKRECRNRDNKKIRLCDDCGGKPSLTKPGSEKIAGLLTMLPLFTRDNDVWEMAGKPIGTFYLICTLMAADGVTVVGQGRGAATLSDHYNDANKTIKMAEKSAQMDAILRAGGLSEIFTQDMGGSGREPEGRDEEPEPQQPARPVQQIRNAPAPATPARATPAPEQPPQAPSDVVAGLRKLGGMLKDPAGIAILLSGLDVPDMGAIEAAAPIRSALVLDLFRQLWRLDITAVEFCRMKWGSACGKPIRDLAELPDSRLKALTGFLAKMEAPQS